MNTINNSQSGTSRKTRTIKKSKVQHKLDESANLTLPPSSDSQVMSRIGQIPIVHDGLNTVKTYTQNPNSRFVQFVRPIANMAGTLHESSARLVQQSPFTSQLKFLDHYGCQSLNYLEERFPIINRPTDEVVAACQSTIEPVVAIGRSVLGYIKFI
ncbi:Perilipin-2 [Basidiobolus ranarum]|uniref:Perilipin-2 n=1 Tax=Basidiobolus ranarum TaxID=34480 RepID=A0ABR2WBK7_9FUNG